MSEDVLQVNQGSLYPALHRLEHKNWIEAEWKVSELGRRAKYYLGLPPADARARAQAKFGSAATLQYALRTFRRAPLTIVVTVAIGLGVVAVLFTVLNALLFKADSVPDVTEIYAVERPPQANGVASVSKRCDRTRTSSPNPTRR